jgi:hypothetical protein
VPGGKATACRQLQKSPRKQGGGHSYRLIFG